MLPSRDDAWALLTEYTKSDSLLKHALAVEAAVRGYARTFGEDEDSWGIVALLHDFDYERWPSADDHPFRGVEILRERGYPEWATRAILSHADYSGVARESRLEKTLFACDEMAGFITAASTASACFRRLSLFVYSVSSAQASSRLGSMRMFDQPPTLGRFRSERKRFVHDTCDRRCDAERHDV